MVFDILIQSTTSVEKATAEELTPLIVAGVKAGNIVDVHSCVDYVNAQVDPDVCGDDIEGILKKVIADARKMSSEADRCIVAGETLEDGDYFTAAEITAFKIAEYGSEEAWISAVSGTEGEI